MKVVFVSENHTRRGKKFGEGGRERGREGVKQKKAFPRK